MEQSRERRQSDRVTPSSPDIGILYSEGMGYTSGTMIVDDSRSLYVDILNRGTDGLMIKTSQPIEPQTSIHLSIFARDDKTWRHFKGTVIWMKPVAEKMESYLAGAAIQECVPNGQWPEPARLGKHIPSQEDYLFFRRTKLLKAVAREAVCPLLNALTYFKIGAGQRLMTQGSPGNSCYLIQSGICAVTVEKGGEFKTVARLRAGSIIGEMAILTGEPRSAHVDAETDMEVWQLTRDQFDRISDAYPELRNFLTTIVTEWFDSRKLTAQRTIGKYLITDILGQGAFAIVYRGTHNSLNMPVAIKMMRHDMAMETDFLVKFRDEARIIAQFNHENIIKVYDIEERYRTVFIIMEYLQGQPLKDIIDNMIRLTPRDVVKTTWHICKGLLYAHERGIVHQDIKPDNIYVLPDGSIKIVDFGLAAPCGTECAMSGTPFYMSPEQIECLPIDERTDIYALGITVFEMLTGRRPYPEDDHWAVMDMHVDVDIPDPAELVPDLPPALCSLVKKACARDPEMRYRQIGQVMADLRPLNAAFYLKEETARNCAKKTASFSIVYDEDQMPTLQLLLDEFGTKVLDSGMEMKLKARSGS